MKIDLSFWRFVIILAFAKSGLWGKANTTYFLHIGTFHNDKNSALSIILLPISLSIGFIKKSENETKET